MLIRKTISGFSLVSARQFRMFSHHTGEKGTTLVGRHKSFARITSEYNTPGLCEKILGCFQGGDTDIYSIKSKVEVTKKDGLDKVVFDLSFDNRDPEAVEQIIGDLKKLGIEFKVQSPPIVDWFPTSLADLDKIGKHQRPLDAVDYDEEMNTKKGGAKRELKKQAFLEKMKTHKLTDPLPEQEWELHETKLWVKVYDQVNSRRMKYSTRSFNRNFEMLKKENLLAPDTVPKLDQLNTFLREKSNWRLKPVGEGLTQREFLNALAFRTSCINMFMRPHESAEILAETDILHQVLSHVPMLLDPRLCELLQRLGQLSLGATDHQILELFTIYWFTVELGLYKEEGEYRFLGASFTGSANNLDELDKITNKSGEIVKKLDLVQGTLPYAEFKMTNVQPFYFYMDGYADFEKQIDTYMDSFYKPFNLRYNYGNNTYDVDRAIYTVLPGAKNLAARPPPFMGSLDAVKASANGMGMGGMGN